MHRDFLGREVNSRKKRGIRKSLIFGKRNSYHGHRHDPGIQVEVSLKEEQEEVCVPGLHEEAPEVGFQEGEGIVFQEAEQDCCPQDL